MKRVLIILPLLFPSVVQASPVPRTLTSINRPFVKLKDLFQNVGAKGNQIIGPSPDPGHRIDVGPAQLEVIAKQFGVVWRHDSTSTGVIIDRLGSPVSQSSIQAALQQALSLAGVPPHSKVNFLDFTQPMVPLGARSVTLVNQLHYDQKSNNFQANLLISAPGMNSVTLFITGTVEHTKKAVIATHLLIPGEILTSFDVAICWIPSRQGSLNNITDLSSIYGMQIEQSVAKGALISKRMISTPDLITKGNIVTLTIQMPGLHVAAHGIALASGSKGSVITVLNPNSHDVIEAIVTGREKAQVDPDSTPVVSTAANGATYAMTNDYYTKRH